VRIREADFQRKLADPRWQAVLAEVGCDSFPALRRRFVATPARMKEFVGEGVVLTDDRPLVEFFLSIRNPGRLVDLEMCRPLLDPPDPGVAHFVP
jgi:hypothetical protein